jgi:hypothetical protein
MTYVFLETALCCFANYLRAGRTFVVVALVALSTLFMPATHTLAATSIANTVRDQARSAHRKQQVSACIATRRIMPVRNVACGTGNYPARLTSFTKALPSRRWSNSPPAARAFVFPVTTARWQWARYAARRMAFSQRLVC